MVWWCMMQHQASSKPTKSVSASIHPHSQSALVCACVCVHALLLLLPSPREHTVWHLNGDDNDNDSGGDDDDYGDSVNHHAQAANGRPETPATHHPHPHPHPRPRPLDSLPSPPPRPPRSPRPPLPTSQPRPSCSLALTPARPALPYCPLLQSNAPYRTRPGFSRDRFPRSRPPWPLNLSKLHLNLLLADCIPAAAPEVSLCLHRLPRPSALPGLAPYLTSLRDAWPRLSACRLPLSWPAIRPSPRPYICSPSGASRDEGHGTAAESKGGLGRQANYRWPGRLPPITTQPHLPRLPLLPRPCPSCPWPVPASGHRQPCLTPAATRPCFVPCGWTAWPAAPFPHLLD